MNAFVCSLLLVSVGQASDFELPPERPTARQQPPAAIGMGASNGPAQLPMGDTAASLPASSLAMPPTATSSPQLPSRQPQTRAPVQLSLEEQSSSVSLTDRTEPVVPVHANDAIEVANEILNEAVRSIDLDGTPLRLVRLLESAESTDRARLLKSYWNLSVAIGRFAFAEHEAMYLQRLGRPQSRTEDALLQAQIARSAARRSEARLEAIRWQERVAGLTLANNSKLPVPTDLPFIGVYRTRIEKLYGRSQAPRRLRQIDRALPHELEIISRRAESIVAFERLLTELRDAYNNGAASLGQILQASDELSAERTKFLDMVLAYNEHIADYSLAVVAPNTAPTTLLSTLIHTDRASRAPFVADSRVQPASAEAPVYSDLPSRVRNDQSARRR